MRRPVLYAILIGSALGLWLFERVGMAPELLVSGAVLITLALGKGKYWLAAGTIAMLIGLGREAAWIGGADAAWSKVIGHSVTISGLVENNLSGQARFTAIRVEGKKLPGAMEIRATAEPGRRLTIICQPEAVVKTNAWRYTAQRLMARCATAEIKSDLPDHYLGRLYALRAKLTKVLNINLRTAEGALAAGILFGDKADFPSELAEAFRRTGTTHIIALSGFNVTIILQTLMIFMTSWLGRRRAAITGGMVVVAFVVMTGASASVVRAAVMAGVAQTSGLIGRPVQVSRLLGYTVLIMTWFNPVLLWHDLGFQLSVASTFGLMTWSGPIGQRLTWLPSWYGMRENAASTLAATAASLPLTMLAFQRLSLIAPLVNVLVLPLVPWAMAAAALLALGGLIYAPVVDLLRPLTELLHTAILKIISVGAGVPGAAVQIPGAAAAAITVALVIYLINREKVSHHR